MAEGGGLEPHVHSASLILKISLAPTAWHLPRMTASPVYAGEAVLFQFIACSLVLRLQMVQRSA